MLFRSNDTATTEIYTCLDTLSLHDRSSDLTADIILHKVTPVLAPAFWLAFTEKGQVRPGDPWRWLIFPGVYLVYALARGLSGDLYAYPFLNLDRLGVGRVALNMVLMGAGYVAAGFGILALDRRLARG